MSCAANTPFHAAIAVGGLPFSMIACGSASDFFRLAALVKSAAGGTSTFPVGPSPLPCSPWQAAQGFS